MLDAALKRRSTITATGYNNSEPALKQIPALRGWSCHVTV
jgi:hypothetical protein